MVFVYSFRILFRIDRTYGKLYFVTRWIWNDNVFVQGPIRKYIRNDSSFRNVESIFVWFLYYIGLFRIRFSYFGHYFFVIFDRTKRKRFRILSFVSYFGNDFRILFRIGIEKNVSVLFSYGLTVPDVYYPSWFNDTNFLRIENVSDYLYAMYGKIWIKILDNNAALAGTLENC